MSGKRILTRNISIKEGRSRVIIEGIEPQIDGGAFPAKRVVGDRVTVEADIFADGHDSLSAVLLYRKESEKQWAETPMTFLVNDRWRGEFQVTELGDYYYTVQGWVDRFKSWRHGFAKKVEANQEVSLDLLSGADLVDLGARRAAGDDRRALEGFAKAMRSKKKRRRVRTGAAGS